MLAGLFFQRTRMFARRLVVRCLMLFGTTVVAVAVPLTVQAEHEGTIQVLLLGDSTTEGSIPRLLKPAGPHLERVIEQLLDAEEDLPPVAVINSSLSGEYI